MNSFEKSLAEGWRNERYFATKVMELGDCLLWPLTEQENMDNHADFLLSIRYGDGVLTASVDVKGDKRIAETGNVVFEMWSNKLEEPWTAGWGQAQTDYIAVVDDSENVSDPKKRQMWLLRLRDLQEFFVHHRDELKSHYIEKRDDHGRIVQKTEFFLISMSDFSKENGYWYYPCGDLTRGIWNGTGDEWEFMDARFCNFTYLPPYMTMLDDTPLWTEAACERWTINLASQQEAFRRDYIDPNNGFPWHMLIDGHPICGMIIPKKPIYAAVEENQ